MAITGVHALLGSAEAEALRATLRDGLGLPHVDSGEGWPIFALPPAELGVHPAAAPSHELSLVCDDLATVADQRGKGIEFRGEPSDAGWGVGITMVLPGDVEISCTSPPRDGDLSAHR